MPHTQTISIPGPDGAQPARLDLPPEGPAPHACAIIAHCFNCTGERDPGVDLSRALTREGLTVLRFDFTGREGPADTTLSASVESLVAAAAFMTERGTPPVLIAGHSLGGTAALLAAARIPSLLAVATLGAPADPSTLPGIGSATAVADGGEGFRISPRLLEDLGEARVAEALRRIELPLLVMHSPQDMIVGIDQATRLFRAARGPRSFVSLDGADHLLTRREDAEYAGRVIAAWASRYLPHLEDAPVEALPAQGEVTSVTRAAGFRTEIAVGHHRFVADEPVAVGGADAGPSPYDLLLAALGACTGMTLQMYARRKGWPLEEATVRLRHGKVHALDDRHLGEPDARVDHVDREVMLEGPLDETQRQRLLEIANRCPVHRTLDAGVRTTTTLAPAEAS